MGEKGKKTDTASWRKGGLAIEIKGGRWRLSREILERESALEGRARLAVNTLEGKAEGHLFIGGRRNPCSVFFAKNQHLRTSSHQHWEGIDSTERKDLSRPKRLTGYLFRFLKKKGKATSPAEEKKDSSSSRVFWVPKIPLGELHGKRTSSLL